MSVRETSLGDRPLRLWVPEGATPATGWPLLVLLDADWVWPVEPAPAGLGDCAVLLPGHGPQGQARRRRALDYTPPAPGGGLWPDPRQPQWQCGGAPAFLAWLTGPALRWARCQVRLDSARSSLYGHSYGGLFVLYVLAHRPDAFSQLMCASPSLWWQDGHMLKQMAQVRAQPPRRRVCLTLMAGGAEQWYSSPPAAGGRREGGRPTLPVVQALADELQGIPRLAVRLEVLPGLGHGPMLGASARRAIGLAARPCGPL